MGMRPPADDGSEPDVIEFGIAALDERLGEADLTYPTDAATVVEECGDVEVPYDATGNTLRLEEALAEADAREFEHEQELLNALHPVFEAKREAAANSLVAQLRALVPF